MAATAAFTGLVAWGQDAPAPKLDIDPASLKQWNVRVSRYLAQEIPTNAAGTETRIRERWTLYASPVEFAYYWPNFGYLELGEDSYSAMLHVSASPVPWDASATEAKTVSLIWSLSDTDESPIAATASVTRGAKADGTPIVGLTVPVPIKKLSGVSKSRPLVLKLPGGFSVALTEASVRGIRGKLP